MNVKPEQLNSAYIKRKQTKPQVVEPQPVEEQKKILKAIEEEPEKYEVERNEQGQITKATLKKRVLDFQGKRKNYYKDINEKEYFFNQGKLNLIVENKMYYETQRIGGAQILRGKLEKQKEIIFNYDEQTKTQTDYSSILFNKYDTINTGYAREQKRKESKAVTSKESFVIEKGKVKIKNEKTGELRDPTKTESKQAIEFAKQRNKNLQELRQDQVSSREITTKINKGIATNKDYVNYFNLATKYGNDLNQVKQSIKIGELNKNKIKTSSTEKVFSSAQNFIDKNPNLKVSEETKIKRFYNEKGEIIGVEGLGQSILAPKGSIFNEEDIKKAELVATANLNLNQLKLKNNKEQLTPAGKLFKTVGNTVDKTFKKIGIDFAEEKREWQTGFGILKTEITNQYDAVKDFISRNTKLDELSKEGGVSIGPVIEKGIAENILVGVEPNNKNNTIILNNFALEGYDVKPLYEILENKREKVLEIGTKQANRMVQSFYAKYEPVKVGPLTLLNERQIKSLAVTTNVVAELGLGVVDMALILGSKATEKPITTASIIATGVTAYSVAPQVTSTAFVGLNVYDWVSRPTSEEKILAIGGDLGLSAIAVGAPKFIEAQTTKLNSNYAKVEVDALGKKAIKGVDIGEDARKVDIELVPAGSKPKPPKINDNLLLKQYGDSIPLKDSPSIPKLTKFEEQFLDILKEDEIKFSTDTSIGGSFGQEVLLKKGRGYKDFDVVTDDPLLIAMKTKEKFGDLVEFKKQTITDSPLGSFDIYKVAKRQPDGSLKHFADIDPIKYAEEGLAIKYGTVEVEGLPVTDIQSRFVAKIKQASRGKATTKVLEDIKLLSDGQINMNSQSVKGAFGWSFLEQSKFVDTTGDIITAQRGLFKETPFNKFKEEIIINKPTTEGNDFLEASFFASPPDIVTGNPQLRASRLGLYSENKADIIDLLSGNVQIGKGKPQAVLFPDAKIADIPEELKSIFAKAKKGDKTAETEFFKRYKEYQMTPTGEFKPFGYQGTEAEITLSPFEIIKGEGEIATTLINNQKVSIIKANIKKASPELAELQKKSLTETLTKTETNKLNELIKQESGDISTGPTKPIISEEDIISSASQIREIKPTKTILLKNTSSKSEISTSQELLLSNNNSSQLIKMNKSIPIKNYRTSTQLKTSSAQISSSDSQSRSTPSLEVSSTPLILNQSPPTYFQSPDSQISDSQRISTEQIKKQNTPSLSSSTPRRNNKKRFGGYDIYVKTKGIWTKANTQPIRTKTEAENFGRFVVAETPQASFKTQKSLSKQQTISFNSKINPNQFYKKGKTFIEKNKFRINTQGELSGITFKGLQSQVFKKNNKQLKMWG